MNAPQLTALQSSPFVVQDISTVTIAATDGASTRMPDMTPQPKAESANNGTAKARRKRPRSWLGVKPGQFHCLIRQCTLPDCEEWFVGTPASRYCDAHKKTQYAKAKAGWQRAHRDAGVTPGRSSRFSEEEIKEMRDMFFRMSAKEVAKHFNCRPSLIYKYLHKNPQRYRST